MKYAAYTLLTFVALLLFLPASGTTEIRNLPLLIAILTILCVLLIIRAAQRILRISEIKKALRENGCSIEYSTVIPNLFAIKGRYDIRAQRASTKINVLLLRIKKASWHCHFDNINKLEYYITAHAVIHGGNNSVKGARVSKATSTRRIAKAPLPFDIKDGEKYILILDRAPARISDTYCTSLFAGDMIEGKILLTTMDKLDVLSAI